CRGTEKRRSTCRGNSGRLLLPEEAGPLDSMMYRTPHKTVSRPTVSIGKPTQDCQGGIVTKRTIRGRRECYRLQRTPRLAEPNNRQCKGDPEVPVHSASQQQRRW